ncbi:hypothetical protein Har1130_11150 [Haloarcula sp. CBA1130]|uniref:hypothetical protein n=1 Tax=unclassified Haloarcula TaxID=2624677 RepID=UPI0012448204|nr:MULTISPECIES: hypothetical protein [unclassified Haloarcula]KAA9398762.1 hypothetical protein Har1129_11245 [Haloarcula sp. CBA1129]KAA9403277.1 hypothetical protein Har1130_11150 [Haloarcula sp. CBA1130]
MSPSIRSLTGDFAALFSSLVLLGPLTLGLLVGAATIIVGVLEIAVPNVLGIVGVAVAVLLALWMVLEGALVQRHGLAVIDRGGPVQRSGRYLLVGVTTVAGFVVSTRVLVLALPWAVETRNTPVQVLGVLLAVALVATVYRTLTAARDGYRSSGERRE